MFLTPDELATLTGVRRPSAQIRFLRSRRIRHIVNLAGHPIVERSLFTAEGNTPDAEPSPDKPWVGTGLSPHNWLGANFNDTYRRSAPLLPSDEWPSENITGVGVYFLFYGKTLIYVGQTDDFQWRLSDHEERFVFDGVATILVPQLLRGAVEAYYIHRERPPLNIKYPPLAACLAVHLNQC